MKKLAVYVSSDPNQHRLLGTLAEADRRIYFEYDSDFLKAPLWLSPFNLPPTPGLHEHRDHHFGPLFGLFDDSLPDGWGLLLMDRAFRKMGIQPERVSPLDRLAYMGSRSMGALSYRPANQDAGGEPSDLDLQVLSGEAYKVLNGNASDVLPQLLVEGGSPGGARPKVLVGVKGSHLISGSDVLPEGYTGWIVKFHGRQDANEEGKIEFAYSNMARAAGLDIPESRLFTTSDGDSFFGIKRFDRSHNQRIHMHTFGNLIHANFRIPNCDYIQLLKCTRVLTKNQKDVQAAFRLMVFNVFSHNRDDHVKNVAFILNSRNQWEIAPAYDLTFSSGPGGEHSMTIDGEGKNPSIAQLLSVAASGGIASAKARTIIGEVKAGISKWVLFAEEAGLKQSTRKMIQSQLHI